MVGNLLHRKIETNKENPFLTEEKYHHTNIELTLKHAIKEYRITFPVKSSTITMIIETPKR